MTLRQLSVYLGHIPTIMAKEALVESMVASLPYMDDESRTQVIQEWVGLSTGTRVPETFAEKWTGDRLSFEEFTQGEMRERVN